MTKKTQKLNEEQQKKSLCVLRFGRVSFNIILGIVGFLVIIIGIGILIYQGNAAKNTLKEYQAIQIFLKLDDLAHTQINTTTMTGIAYGFPGIKEFKGIDNNFHTAKTFAEKSKYAQEMAVFLEELNKYLNTTIGISTQEDWIREQRYSKIHNAFLEIQQTFYPN